MKRGLPVPTRGATLAAGLLLLAGPAGAQPRLDYRIHRQPVQAATPVAAPFVMAIDDVFLAKHGTIVTGRIESGAVRVGDDLELVGTGLTLRIRVEGIDRFRRHVLQASAGQSVAIHFYRTRPGHVFRGAVLATTGAMQGCVEFDALATPLPQGRGGTADFRFRNLEIDGRIIYSGPARPGNGTVPARVQLGSSVAMSPGQPFAIGRKGHFSASGTVVRCRLGVGINDENNDDNLVGLIDGALVVDHGEESMDGLVAWIIAHRLGIAREHIRPESRIVEDLGLGRDAVVKTIEEAMYVDISDEQAARIATVADAARVARKALDQIAR